MLVRSLMVLVVTPLISIAQGQAQNLPEVTVTATRSDFATHAQPMTVTVFDHAALRASGATQVADILRLVPGVTLLSNGSFGTQTSLFMRGGESDYVQVLVDGVPLNRPGGTFDFGQLTLDNVERVEVMRGPASVLYGSDAVSGVIQIFTRNAPRKTELTGSLGKGTYGSSDYSLGIAGGVTSASWSLDASRHLTDGIHPFNSAFRNDILSGALRMRGARADAAVSARFTNYTLHYPTNSAGALADSNAHAAEEGRLWSFEGGWKAAHAFELRARVADNRADPSTRDLPDYDADKNSFVADARVTRLVSELRAITTLGGAHQLTLAWERARDREHSASHSESDFGPFDDALSASRTNTGLSAQLLGNLGRDATYTVGVRHDENSAFGGFTTVRAAGALKLSPRVSARASVGTAFKAPSFFENFASGFVVGNPALTPERTRSFEVGARYASANESVSLGVTAFTQRFRDLIQYVSVVAPNAPNYANLAGASADGVELELGWRLAPGLVATGSYTYLRTRVTDAGADEGPSASFVQGDRLLRRPTHLAVANLRESVAGQGSADITLTYTGARDDRDFATFPATPVVMKAFVRVDAAVERPLDDFGPLHQPALVVRVRNATNKTYQEALGYRAPGRMYYVGLRVGR